MAKQPEQNAIGYNTEGIEQNRHQYLAYVAAGAKFKRPGPIPKRAIPPPSNWGLVEKVPAPKTATNMRTLFESGVPDIHAVEKIQVNLKTGEGSGVYENEPVYLDGVVRESDGLIEEHGEGVYENQPVYLEGVVRETDDLLEEKEGTGVYENQPVYLQGVVRESDSLEDEEGPGVYENQPNYLEGVVRETDDLQEEKGQCVYENQPDYLEGVVRESDDLLEDDGPGVYENQPDYLTGVVRESDTMADDEGVIIENQPAVRTDVFREDDANGVPTTGEANDELVQDKWITQKEKPIRKKPIKLEENEWDWFYNGDW